VVGGPSEAEAHYEGIASSRENSKEAIARLEAELASFQLERGIRPGGEAGGLAEEPDGGHRGDCSGRGAPVPESSSPFLPGVVL